MAEWGCLGCGTVYRLRISRCPRCHGERFQEGPVALLVCQACTTAYAAGLPGCPHCGGTDHHEEGSMPKITRHGGASIAGEPAAPVGTEPGCQHPDCVLDHPHAGPAILADPTEEGGAPSPGSSSSASSPKQQKSSAPTKSSRRKPAPTTESPSAPDPTEGSTAPSTDGPGTGDQQ